MTLGSGEEQSYLYDDFGNLFDIERRGTRTYSRSLPVDRKTNRLASASYDEAGNMISPPGGGIRFSWSTLGTLTSRSTQLGEEISQYLYTADGERIGIFHHPSREWTWRLRDLEGKLLREWKGGADGPLIFFDGFEAGTLDLWSAGRAPGCDDLVWVRDYVHRGGTVLASFHWSTGVIHHHPDHLGSPIGSTNQQGALDDTGLLCVRRRAR